MSSLVFLKAKEDVRAVTWRPFTRVSALMISSVMPSLKNSFSGSELMFTNGSTATLFACATRPDPTADSGGISSPSFAIAYTVIGYLMFLRLNEPSPRVRIPAWFLTSSYTFPEIRTEWGTPSPSIREATLTPSPNTPFSS